MKMVFQPTININIFWITQLVIAGFFSKFLLPLALRKKCPYSELFWFAFSRIQTECYLVRMRKNAGQNNSEFRYFSRSVKVSDNYKFLLLNGGYVKSKKLSYQILTTANEQKLKSQVMPSFKHLPKP